MNPSFSTLHHTVLHNEPSVHKLVWYTTVYHTLTTGHTIYCANTPSFSTLQLSKCHHLLKVNNFLIIWFHWKEEKNTEQIMSDAKKETEHVGDGGDSDGSETNLNVRKQSKVYVPMTVTALYSEHTWSSNVMDTSQRIWRPLVWSKTWFSQMMGRSRQWKLVFYIPAKIFKGKNYQKKLNMNYIKCLVVKQYFS